MKNIFTLILLLCIVSINLSAQKESPATILLPKYEVKNQILHDKIVALDRQFFDAYNSCDIEVHKELLAEDIEFYHDMGGLATSKSDLLQALKDNICDKVTRELIPGTIEVYEIPGYGAVQMGWHQFHNNEEPDAIPKPSKFVTIWKLENDKWSISRVISLH